jgi:beta-mannanase
MRKILIYIIILSGIVMAIVATHKYRGYYHYFFPQTKTNSIEFNTTEPVLAMFSFNPGIEKRSIDNFPHIRVVITDKGKWEINNKLPEGIADTIPVMLTVETWNGKRLNLDFNGPLQKLLKGSYDKAIQGFCEQVVGNRPNVYIRFNPEMEVPAYHFPWQFGYEYIEAFRYFAEACKRISPQVKMVWGPAGYPGAMEAYPGDDVVDVATVTIKSDSEQTLDVYPKDYTVQYDILRRLHRLRFISKPIYVFGSSQITNDSVHSELIDSISHIIEYERNIVYSIENFQRPDEKLFERKSGIPEIGLYDPQSLLNTNEHITVEHLFVDFTSLDNGEFEEDFLNVVQRGHDVIVSFEPFRLKNDKTDLQVLRNITAGLYDREIEKFYEILAQTERHVYLRYAHEMEIPITRYPWQSQDPVEYIHSYRYFMNFLDVFPRNMSRIWGPAGDRGSIEWYPGDDVVDFVSIAIYGLPDKNITDPEMQETFSTIFHRKIWRLRFIEKPVFITEFGVKGPDEYQRKWLEDAAVVIRENPQVVGINYFNMSDTPKAWGDIKPPDWSISATTLNRFIEVLKGDSK